MSGLWAFLTRQKADDLYQALSEKDAASGYAALNSSSKVVKDPANATATPTASKIPIADGSAKLDGWVSSGAAAGTPSLRAIGTGATEAAAGNHTHSGTPQVAQGSYTGNAGTDRTISLPFTPKLVIIYQEDLSHMFVSNVNTGTKGLRVDAVTPAADVWSTNGRRPLLTTNGFIVSEAGTSDTNSSGLTYHYFAIG